MDISIGNVFRSIPTDVGTVASSLAKPAAEDRPVMTVSSHAPSVLDSVGEAGDISDAALRRDDDLGNLFARAFDLPAAPMPPFGAIAP